MSVEQSVHLVVLAWLELKRGRFEQIFTLLVQFFVGDVKILELEVGLLEDSFVIFIVIWSI